MYVTHHLMVKNPCAKNATVKANRSYGSAMKPCQKKNYKFDLKVKDKGHTGVMNVGITSSDGDAPMCQTWYMYANAKAKKKLRGSDANLHRRTDSPTE